METVLIFAGIPALVIALVTLAVYAGGARRARRYRPGRPFEYAPVWFLSAPEQLVPDRGLDRGPALGTGERRALAGRTAGPSPAGGEWPAADPTGHDVTGGASDRW